MAHLILVRHGESEWNAKGLWTGWTDVSLSEKGIHEAQQAAEEIKDIQPTIAFTSKLKRAQQTLDEIKKILHCESIPTYQSESLNERD
ncbi:MAG TPA: 2,3-bisphosphoglycerate-dependent phosphoglycerate mutase, partial [Candidatus Saccharimonadales bacterium]|nr:2,3-bisphosphoglycerate-dependent phosphoglycerate mutase [Candidatus Saccharimonadales bacterium]